jgi:hypothetical protein
VGDFHWTVPELTVRVNWQPGTLIWQRFHSDQDPDPNRRSGSVANTTRIWKPHTMHGARDSACFGCIHDQSGWDRPHQVLRRPWMQSALWRQWQHRYWEESKTSKRGQS